MVCFCPVPVNQFNIHVVFLYIGKMEQNLHNLLMNANKNKNSQSIVVALGSILLYYALILPERRITERTTNQQ